MTFFTAQLWMTRGCAGFKQRIESNPIMCWLKQAICKVRRVLVPGCCTSTAKNGGGAPGSCCRIPLFVFETHDVVSVLGMSRHMQEAATVVGIVGIRVRVSG